MSDAAVETSGLIKRFQTRSRGIIHAVQGLSVKCYRGQIYGLLGPNGAGKTTTLRMLGTLLTPTSGNAVVNTYSVQQQPQRVRSSIGYLATETGVYDGLTTRETLRFFGEINGLQGSSLSTRIEELASILNMDEFVDRRVGKLSTGMKQKLSLARSVIHDPPVLIFDEPTAGLDVMTAKTVTNYIQVFKEQGKAVIVSTHQMRVAEQLCDRIGILFDGKLKADGSLENLYAQYDVNDLEEVFFQLVEEPNE